MKLFKFTPVLGAVVLSACAYEAPVVIPPEQKPPSFKAWQECMAVYSGAKLARCAAVDPPKPSHLMPEGPVRPDFDVAAQAYILSALKDPESARVHLIRGPRKGKLPDRFFG